MNLSYYLHYITFIDPLIVPPIDVLSFESEQFINNFINKVIETKTNEPFILLKENFLGAVLLYKKNYEVLSEHLSHEVLEFFSEL
jgi:hypothetical protein